MTKPLAIGLLAAMFASTSPTAAADSPKPLRTLVYEVQYSAVISRENHDSGIGTSGSGHSSFGAAQADSGTVTIDVLAATDDAGLVLDASFAGKPQNQSPVRFALSADGALRWNQNTEVAAEVLRLLPMLARGMTKDRDFTAGANWTTPAPPPAVGTRTFKVRSVDGTVANLEIEHTVRYPAPSNVDETGNATAVYETFRVCPLKYQLRAQSRHQESIARTDSIDYQFSAKLQSDTLAGTKAP